MRGITTPAKVLVSASDYKITTDKLRQHIRDDLLGYLLSWLNMACWIACFWWMHRISSRQDLFLRELKDQGIRIEGLSKVEHDLLKEVHPQVGEIKQAMAEVVESTRDRPEEKPKDKSKERRKRFWFK